MRQWGGETAAIARVAARYGAEIPDGRPESCAARPGRGGTWLVVTCGGGERLRVYGVDRGGRIAAEPGGT